VLKFLFLEPFFGGSHRNFAEGLIAHSKHRFELMSLPARFWKWRMRGAALHFVRTIQTLDEYDGIFATNLMSLADFKALSREPCPPVLVYFHENQLTYPLAPGEMMDYQFGFTDITTALSADRILFNSKTHYKNFFSAIPEFIHNMPEFRPNWVVDHIKKKADILYPGCQFSSREMPLKTAGSSPPLIIWNHRWEFDKDPGAFFHALDALTQHRMDFHIALLGENFQVIPKEFIAARKRYQDRIVQYGYVKNKREYYDWLRRGDIVISTAKQENFGIAVIEAIRYGCFPLLPNRLVYPEIIPETFHEQVLYDGNMDLVEKLLSVMQAYPTFQAQRRALSEAMAKYAWDRVIEGYDHEFEELVTR
jgi:glycosyltransferase involved in cell wall biosynthesis